MAGLLVSVRSVAEAEAALAGGAALVDVKEPARGALGRAGDDVIAAVVRFVAGRRPVSAAMGELREAVPPFAGPGLIHAKWGLAGCGADSRWPRAFAEARQRLERSAPGCRVVIAAYADWRDAQAPHPDQVCAFACQRPEAVFLLDTWGKTGKTLLHWLTPAEIGALCRRCREAGVRVALAGSLGPAHIRLLGATDPDWFAVRGAACRSGRRDAAIDPARVRRLAGLLAQPLTAATHAD
jgi:hypothetical protein